MRKEKKKQCIRFIGSWVFENCSLYKALPKKLSPFEICCSLMFENKIKKRNLIECARIFHFFLKQRVEYFLADVVLIKRILNCLFSFY